MAEEILYEAHPSMFRNHPIGFILCLILSLVGIGLIIFLFWWLDSKGTKLTVTSQRTTLRRGILAKNTNDVYHTDVRNVQVSQSMMQRVFGVATIGISSAGQSGLEIEVAGMRDPEQIKDIIAQHRGQKD